MTTIRIWHKKKHDDFTVTEIETDTPRQFAIDAFRAGGYWHNDVFVPWHSISYIQAEYARDRHLFATSPECDGRPEHRVSGPFGSTHIEDCNHTAEQRRKPRSPHETT